MDILGFLHLGTMGYSGPFKYMLAQGINRAEQNRTGSDYRMVTIDFNVDPVGKVDVDEVVDKLESNVFNERTDEELWVFYEVTLPLIAPGIIASMLFAFTIAFDNFTQTFLWEGTNTETLPISIYSKILTGLDQTINAIRTVIVLFSLSIAVAAENLSERVVD